MASAVNINVIQFPTPGAEWGRPSDYGLWTASSGGTFLGSDSLTSTVSAPPSGSDVEFAAGALTIEIPNGEFSAAGARIALVAYLSNGTGTSTLADGGTTITITDSTTATGIESGTNLQSGIYVSLHSGDPGTAGTANELNQTGYARAFIPINRLNTGGTGVDTANGPVGGWNIT